LTKSHKIEPWIIIKNLNSHFFLWWSLMLYCNLEQVLINLREL
jgi:hypothetical protein